MENWGWFGLVLFIFATFWASSVIGSLKALEKSSDEAVSMLRLLYKQLTEENTSLLHGLQGQLQSIEDRLPRTEKEQEDAAIDAMLDFQKENPRT